MTDTEIQDSNQEENQKGDREDVVLVKPKFPLSVALVGAPNSGKDEVARKFVKIITPWLSEHGQEIVYLKNSGNTVSKDYNLALGPFGSYRDSLWVLFDRLSKEHKALAKGKSFVVSGTLIDTFAHVGAKYETVMLGAEKGLILPETNLDIQKLQSAMVLMTYLFVDTFRYKFAFYLPYGSKIVVPGEEIDDDDRFSRRIDGALQDILQNFNISLQTLDQSLDSEAKAQVMFDTIKKIYEEGVEVPSSTVETLDP